MKLIEKIKEKQKNQSFNRRKMNSALNNLVATNVIFKTNKSNETNIINLIFNILFTFIGVFGINYCVNGFFNDTNSLFSAFVISLIISIAICLASNSKKPLIFIIIVSAFFIITMFLICNNFTKLGYLFNDITMAITKSVKTAIYDFQIMAFLYIAISLTSAIIFNVSLKIKWGFTFIGLFCILILAPIYYSYNFPEPIALILVLIFLLSCFIRIIFNNSSNKMNLSKQKNIDEKKLHKSFIEKIAAIIIVISIFSFSIANIVNPATSNTFPELIRSLNTEVRTFINELLREKITEPTTLSFGQLGKTDKIVYKFKPVAQMSIAKNTAVYLRMWSADTYKASTWINDSQSFKFAINDYINSSQADSNLVNYLNNNITNNSLALDVNTFGKTFFDVLKMDKEFKLDENGFIENNVTFYPLENIADDLKELMGVNKFVPLGASSLENPFFLKNREDLSQIVDYSEYNTIGFKSDSFSFSSLIAQATHDEKFNEKIAILSENYKKACDLIIEDENADIDLKNRILAERLYSQYAKEKNVEISADLSDRTIAKAKELAGKDVFETFDNIKNYLNDNTSYTLSPGITPSESDYIDHFLFKAKKGFCTHYASTAVQMLRQNGYVARYAEGYRAQFKKGFGEYTPEGKIDILDSDGHAWVEVYFDGIGWIPFEATPSFETKILEYNPEGDVNTSTYKAEVNISYDNTVKSSNQSTDEITIGENIYIKAAFYILLIAIIITLIIIGEVSIRRKRRNNKFKNENNKIAVINMFKFILNIFSMCDIKISKGEKLQNFAVRADIAYPFAQKGDCVKIMDIFLQAKFGSEEITVEQLDFMYNFINNSIKNIYKQNTLIKNIYLYIIKAL